MNRPDLSGLARTARRLSWPLRNRVGLAGAAGLALLLVGASLAAVQVALQPRAQKALAELQRETATLAEQTRQLQASKPPGPAETLKALPSPEAYVADLRTLFELATQHRLELERSEHQLLSASDAPLVVVVVTLPLRGSYASLKGFATQAIQQMPHLALQDFRLDRPDIGALEVRARIRVAFHYQGAVP